jgi:hypothetical protein
MQNKHGGGLGESNSTHKIFYGGEGPINHWL